MYRIATCPATRKALACNKFLNPRITVQAVNDAFAYRGFATESIKVVPSNNAQNFSSMTVPMTEAEDKPLRVLDMTMVRKIKAELMEVDANSDGRYATYIRCLPG